ncbi:MAG: hypothetical protein WCI36_05355 [bacterium]
MKFIGHCTAEDCEKKNENVNFPVPHDKVDAFKNEPPTCTTCGNFLQGDVIDA